MLQTQTRERACPTYAFFALCPLANAQAAAFAIGLEKALTRREILVLYLNTARFDDAVFGAEAAAKHYFDKPAKSLTVNESALLALELVDPAHVDPKQPDEATVARRDELVAKIRGTARDAGEKRTEGKKSSSTKKQTDAKDDAPAQGPATETAAPEPATTESATPGESSGGY